jgi:hypothetical protein
VEFVEQVLLHKKRGVGGVPLEVLQEKRGVGLQLHVFLGAEFVELDVFGTRGAGAELEKLERSSPKHPLRGCLDPIHFRATKNRGQCLVGNCEL